MTLFDDIFGEGGIFAGLNLFDLLAGGSLLTDNPLFGMAFGGVADSFRLNEAGDENQDLILGEVDSLRDLQGSISAGSILDDAGLPGSVTFGETTFDRPTDLDFFPQTPQVITTRGGTKIFTEETPQPTNFNINDRFTSADVFAENSNFSPINLDSFRFDPSSIDFPDLGAIQTEQLSGIANSARIAQEQLRQDVVSTAGGPENAASELTRLGFLGQIGAGQAAAGVRGNITGLQESRAQQLAGLSAQNLGLLGGLAEFNATTPLKIAELLATLTGQDEAKAADLFTSMFTNPNMQAALADAGFDVGLEQWIASLIAGIQTPVPQLSPTIGDIAGVQLSESPDSGGSGGFLGFG